MTLRGGYPPGCSGPDELSWCLVCQHDDVHCLCTDCPVCGDVGNPDCYDSEGHGLEDPVLAGTLDLREQQAVNVLRGQDAYALRLDAQDASWWMEEQEL